MEELGRRIGRKREEYRNAPFETLLREIVAELLPDIMRLGIPVAFKLSAKDKLALEKREPTAVESLQNIDKAFASLPWSMKGRIQELLTKITITSHVSLDADQDDFSVGVPLDPRVDAETHKRYISHEVGHLLHAAILIADDTYQERINAIDKGTDKKVL